MTWILILALVGPRGDVAQVESIATPFVTWEACNDAGVDARAWFPALTKPGASVWNRIDWVCVATGPAKPARDVCAEREAARERLREEIREAFRIAKARGE
jgi:hypothetical protein